jgi:hypothetical protein
VRENGFTRTPSDSIYVREKDSVQEPVSSYKDNHLKTLIKEGTELRVPILHSGTHKAFLIHVGSAREAIKKKGYFKSFEEYSKTYADKREKIKELKDQLVVLKEASETSAETSGQAGTSRKPNKNPKETTVEASNKDSVPLHATIKAELKQALEDVPRRNVIRRLRTFSSSTPTFCLSTQGTHGTISSMSRPKPTPTRTSKG